MCETFILPLSWNQSMLLLALLLVYWTIALVFFPSLSLFYKKDTSIFYLCIIILYSINGHLKWMIRYYYKGVDSAKNLQS